MTAAAAAPKSPKKASKPKAKPTHPPTAAMVMAAVKALKDAKGSSLPAIKKYIAANYKVDIVKLSPFVRKALKPNIPNISTFYKATTFLVFHIFESSKRKKRDFINSI